MQWDGWIRELQLPGWMQHEFGKKADRIVELRAGITNTDILSESKVILDARPRSSLVLLTSLRMAT